MIDNVYIPEIQIQSNTVLTLDTQGQDITVHVGNLNIQQGHFNISGGNKVEVTGNAEAISRVIFAPEAAVELSGSGRVRGAIVSKSFKAVGNTRVFFEDEFEDDLPEFQLSDGEIVMLHWN